MYILNTVHTDRTYQTYKTVNPILYLLVPHVYDTWSFRNRFSSLVSIVTIDASWLLQFTYEEEFVEIWVQVNPGTNKYLPTHLVNVTLVIINVSANHIEFLLNVRTWISTVQNRGRDGTLDLGWYAAFNTRPWRANSWGDGRITHLRPIVGRNDVIAHLFRPRVWANASKQNGVVQNLNFTIYQNWKDLFQTCKHENLLCSKHYQTPRLLQLSCTVLYTS